MKVSETGSFLQLTLAGPVWRLQPQVLPRQVPRRRFAPAAEEQALGPVCYRIFRLESQIRRLQMMIALAQAPAARLGLLEAKPQVTGAVLQWVEQEEARTNCLRRKGWTRNRKFRLQTKTLPVRTVLLERQDVARRKNSRFAPARPPKAPSLPLRAVCPRWLFSARGRGASRSISHLNSPTRPAKVFHFFH